MGDPLNNPFAQQSLYHRLPPSQGLPTMDNAAGVPQQPPSLAPAIPSMPGGVQDPNQAKLWKAIGDQYRSRPNGGGNPAQFFQNLAHMQPGQRGFPTNHAMALASGPQAGQSNLAQNPTAQQQFLQQQNMQRLGLGLPQQQQQQQLGTGAGPGMPGLQHPNAGQAHLNNLAQSNNPALMSLINNMQNANGMGQPGNQLMNNLLRNPNNVLDLHNRNMLDPSMSEQLQAIQRARGNLAQGGAGAAAGQHIRLPSNEHNSPLLSAPHDQNPMIQGNRSPQPGNPQHQGNMSPQNAQTLALLHKLDSLPTRDLEARVAMWRDNMPNIEARVQELLGAASRPGATPEIGAAYARAKNESDQHKFLFIKAQEILNRKHVQAQMVQVQAQAQAQAHAQAQAAARMTPTIGDQTRPGSRAAGVLPGQAPGMPGWQPQPGPSNTPQLPQGTPPGTSSTPFQPVPSPQPNAEQQNQQTSPAFRPGGPRQTAIPRDRAAFVHFIRLWFVQTGRNLEAIPKIGDKPLDLHQLYIEVETLGGPEKVQATGQWRLVAVKMGYVTHEQNDLQLAQIAKVLADTYVALLVPFDNFCLDRMRAVGNGIQNNRLGQMQQIGMGATQAVPAGMRAGPAGMLPGDSSNPAAMANFQRVLAFLQVTLKDWLPEASPQTKLLRASQMDVPQMQREGWPADRIAIVQRFRPALLQFRATLLRQQQMHQQALSQQGMQQQNAQAQAQQAQQANPQQPQPHVNDHRSSSGGGSLPPNMQGHSLQGLSGPAGAVKLPWAPEIIERARLIVNAMAREIEQTRQYTRREVPEVQRVQMNQSVVTAFPLALEFERTVSLHFMLFNNQQQTKNLMEQSALLREQHRILQNGQQQYIMTLEEVGAVQNSLRMAIHNLKTAYAQKLKHHQEQVVNLRAAEAGGAQLGQQQPNAQQIQQVQQQMLQQHPQQQQQALATMSFLNANAGLAGAQPHLMQQRPPSQPRYGSPKPDPSKASMGLMQQQQQQQQPKASMPVKQRKPVMSGSQPVNTPSPAAAPTPNMESAPTPSSANEPATPKSPKNKAKGPPPKRTPTQAKKKPMKIELPPPNLGFNQPPSNKRQREDEAPPAAESVIPAAGPSSPKRVKTELESVAPIKTEYHNDDPLESMDEALAQLQNAAPGPGGDGIDPDILAQLSEILDGAAGGAAGASGSAQPPSLDQPPDASGGPKVEDVFDFSYYLNDTLGDDDPLGGAAGVDVLEADTPDLNTNKETPDSAADDIDHLGRSPGKGELPAGDGGKNLAGSRAPTLTEGFWEAFNDGEMAEGAYYAGGGANGFNWSGPIEPNASWIGITGTAA